MNATLFSAKALRCGRPSLLQKALSHSLHSTSNHLAKALPPRPVIAEEDLEENFLKGSGPGGQKINKTSSAVQIKHLPTGIVVKSQATRSRSQNRKYARQILAEKLDDLAKGDQSRSAIKTAIKSKKKASAGKKTRRKYRALDAEKTAAQAGEEQEDEEQKGEEKEGQISDSGEQKVGVHSTADRSDNTR